MADLLLPIDFEVLRGLAKALPPEQKRDLIAELQRELEAPKYDLVSSADLYAEIYATDEETRILTEDALKNWPEDE